MFIFSFIFKPKGIEFSDNILFIVWKTLCCNLKKKKLHQKIKNKTGGIFNFLFLIFSSIKKITFNQFVIMLDKCENSKKFIKRWRTRLIFNEIVILCFHKQPLRSLTLTAYIQTAFDKLFLVLLCCEKCLIAQIILYKIRLTCKTKVNSLRPLGQHWKFSE